MIDHSILVTLDWFQKWPQSISVTCTFLLMVGVCTIDYVTGPDFSFSLFYLLPILLATFSHGRRFGLLTCLVAAAAWMRVEHLTLETPLPFGLLLWNSGIRLGFFLIVVLVTSAFTRALERERTHARTDFLTGTANQQGFMERAEIEMRNAHGDRLPVSIAYLDCDNFKAVNDTLGHAVGSLLLQKIGQTMLRHCRASDVVARMGGDEFVLLFPRTTQEQAKKAMDHLHEELMALMKENNWPVTFSVGVVTYHCPFESLEQIVLEHIIKAADNLMYEVKNAGKNSVLYREVKESEGSLLEKLKDRQSPPLAEKHS